MKPEQKISAKNGTKMNGIYVRMPPRRLEATQNVAKLRYDYFVVQNGAVIQHDQAVLAEIKAQMPRDLQHAPCVLLLAAEDVLLTEARVPPVSSARLRDALANVIEEHTLSDITQLHVCKLGAASMQARTSVPALQVLAVIDRVWFAQVLARFHAAGWRLSSVVPEALCVPWVEGTWSLAALLPAADSPARLWLRTGEHHAIALPQQSEAAAALLQLMLQKMTAPLALQAYASEAALPTLHRLMQHLPMQALAISGSADPLRAWLEHSDSNMPASLLQHEFAPSLWSAGAWQTWRRAAALLIAMAAVQLIGMQAQWAQLRSERAQLKAQSEMLLKTSFPETTTILDVPLQMQRSLAALRAGTGQSDPNDFTALVSTAGLVFANAPINAFQGYDYGNEVGNAGGTSGSAAASKTGLRIRLAPGVAVNPQERADLMQRAASNGYALSFDATNSAFNAAGNTPIKAANAGASTALLQLKKS